MLLPRFTVRTGLVALTAGVLLAIVLRSAVRGEPWAVGIAAAVVISGLSLALQALAFAASLLLSREPAPAGIEGPASPDVAESTEGAGR